MDYSAIFAIVLAFASIIVGNAMEGGHLSALIQPTAAFIVFGGTLGAVWLGSTPAELRLLRGMMPRILRPNLADRPKLLEDILQLSSLVRREGMLAAEARLPDITDPLLRRGMQMLVDGSASEDVQEALETEIDMSEHHSTSAAKLWDDAGGYCPTVGILGAVLGLIHVMQNLTDPSALGAGIAVAFVATIYGVGAANLLFLPLGKRLKKVIEVETEDRTMILAGLAAIATGANGRQISEKLAPWVGLHGAKSATPDAAEREAA